MNTDVIPHPHDTWARWQIRRARYTAHHSGTALDRALLFRCLTLSHEARGYYPPGSGLGSAYRHLYELLTTLPPEELTPVAAPAWTDEHARAAVWAKEAVSAEYANAKETGVPFPAVLRCGASLLEGRRLFPGIDVDALVFEEGLNLEPLPDRLPPDPTP